MRYAFDLYDIDGSGQMELFEVIRCVREIWGTRWNQNENAQKIVHKLEIILNEKTQEHSLSYHLFEDFAKRHPLLLFPAFQLQTDLQKAILGENFWIKAAKHRSKMSKHTGLLQWKHIEEMFQSSSVYSENVLRELDEKRLEDLVEKKIKVNQKEENNESMKTKTMKTSKSMTPMINVASSSPQAKGLHKSNSNIELKSKTTITNMSSTTENSTKTKKNKKKTTTITSNTTATSTSTSTFTSNVRAAAAEEEEVVVVTTTTTPITPIKPIPKTNTSTTSITANVLTKKPSEVIEVEKLQLEDLEEEEKFIPRDIVPSRLTVSSSKTKSIRK
jgi:hypothetical protein